MVADEDRYKGHAPFQPGEVLLERDQLRVGDILFGREFDDWSCTGQFEGHHVVDGKNARMHSGKLFQMDHLTGRGRWRVVRPSTAVSSSRWNSTCPDCGCGVYVGFSSVEHDGGRCPRVP